MKTNMVRREWHRPLWVKFKKHYCPVCNSLLGTTTESKIIEYGSKEALNYDFSISGNRFIGNMKYIWTVFHCPACNRKFSIEEIRANEKK